MSGIIRKRVLALLSAAGLVGSTAPLTAQVLKGDEADKTKTESKIKLDKNKQENNAVKSQATVKGNKTVSPADAASKDAIKFNKAQQGSKTSTEDRKDKWAKTGAVQYPIEHGKEASHTNTKSDATIKLTKNAAGKNAAQNDINKKADQASPK